MLEWHTIPLANREDRWIKGTELEYCFPDGFLHRFKIVSVRVIYAEWQNIHGTRKLANTYDVKYRIYDAHTVSDADVKDGIKPKSVGKDFDTLDEALNAIEPFRYKEEPE